MDIWRQRSNFAARETNQDMMKTENITRIFRTEEVETVALDRVGIEVNNGGFTAINESMKNDYEILF